MRSLYKNWFFHNMFAHPISELVYQTVRLFDESKAEALAGAIHDACKPEHEPGTGRG